jgi:hypothetical protein
VAIPERRKFAAPVLAQAASFVVVLVIGGFIGHSPATGSPGPTRTSATPSAGTSSPSGVKGHQSGVSVEVPLNAADSGIAVNIPVKVLNGTTGSTVVSGVLTRNAQNSQLARDEPLPAGTYQVCAQPPAGLRFTDKNTDALPGWVCMIAIVTPGEQTPVVFHLAPGPGVPA